MTGTMAEKVWHDHIVKRGEGGAPDLFYTDLHLVHEVTSPQAFEGLRLAGRKVCRPELTIATEDHNTLTLDVDLPITDETSHLQISTLRENAEEFGIHLHSLGDTDQGIVHIVGPQPGLTRPGMTTVYGDSHTPAHGTFETLAFGTRTSQAGHVLATQTLPLAPFKTMVITMSGSLPQGSNVKDIVLTVIAKIGTGGDQGYVLEYRGQTTRELSMEGRMTVCNMSIEVGTRVGMVAPDETTFGYLKDRPHASEGEERERAVEYWKTPPSNEDVVFDVKVILEAVGIGPSVIWGTSPSQGVPLSSKAPDLKDFSNESQRFAAERALEYIDLKVGTAMRGIRTDMVFLGSCTNGCIEDLRVAAATIKGHKKANSIRMFVAPDSAQIRLQAKAGGLDRVFTKFGAERRNAGCSMRLGVNPDTSSPGEHPVSTSSRNFEGRQGKGGHTHLVLPLIIAAIVMRGTLSSPVDL